MPCTAPLVVKNGSKMCGSTSAGMPGPSSLTSMATVPSTCCETGTGKELAAAAVHKHSPRRGGPFVVVDCGALAEGLLESELFGHVRGAFTGAVRDKADLFEAAAGGTIFLDELGSVSFALQQLLLRVCRSARSPASAPYDPQKRTSA